MSSQFPFEHFISIDSMNSTSNQQQTKSFDHKQDLSDQSVFSTSELGSISKEILLELEKIVSSQKFNAFFKNTFTVSNLTEQLIQFSVTTKFIKTMIQDYYIDSIEQAIQKVLGYKLDIEINVLTENQSVSIPETSQENNQPSFKLSATPQSQEEIKDTVESKFIQHTIGTAKNVRVDRSKNFDNFVIGPSNNMAHAFALAVANNPGVAYPQLYIHGNSGLGKTHILHALCNSVIDNKPHLRLYFTTANDFMNEMVVAIQNGNKINEFRRKYTELTDILIIDDIHELKNRARTQSEFFHIFNELQNKGKQLVFTSDKPPKDILGIEDRIRSRLSSALLIDIQQPDLETRIAILKKKSLEKDIYLSDDVINLIASCIKNNVRELEGNLIKLGAYSDLMNVDIDLEIAKEQLNLKEGNEEKIISIESISKTVASYFKIAIGDLKGKTRKKEIAQARHIAMYMCHKILKKTLEEIGDYFNKRDHSTVIYSIQKIQNQVKDNSKLSQQIYEIESRL